jgi:hypothetical protein
MKTVWTKDLKTEEQKKYFEGLWIASKEFRDKLESIVYDMEKTTMQRGFSESEFEDPNWAYKQAYVNGQLAAYKKVLDILN